MTTRYEMTRRASLEVLRAEAEDERSTMIEGRLRAGEDPWDFMTDLPTVDDLVVLLLRDEVLDEAAAEGRPVDEDELLTAIADAYPQLDATVLALRTGVGRTGARWVARGARGA